MSYADAGSVEVTDADVQPPPYAETRRPSRPSPAPTLAAQLEPGDPAATHLSPFSEVLGPLPVHASVDSPKPRRQAALRPFSEVRPRAGGRLSAAAGCGEHTATWSPTVTTTQSARLSEPWQRDRPAFGCAEHSYVADPIARRTPTQDGGKTNANVRIAAADARGRPIRRGLAHWVHRVSCCWVGRGGGGCCLAWKRQGAEVAAVCRVGLASGLLDRDQQWPGSLVLA